MTKDRWFVNILTIVIVTIGFWIIMGETLAGIRIRAHNRGWDERGRYEDSIKAEQFAWVKKFVPMTVNRTKPIKTKRSSHK